jgi:carbamoyl-phosphate synthase large subunit
VLVDRFLDDAIEIDVDALFDGEQLYLGGVMEHIEEAGIHSGDSACVLPPVTLGREEVERVRSSTEAIARGIGVRGLLNVQYALVSDVLYVLEANPRASRTVPVRLQGDRRTAGQGRRARHGRRLARRPAARGPAPGARRRGQLPLDAPGLGEGGRAAVPPVPDRRRARRRHAARTRDALDRRGHGHRRELRHSVREVAGRRVRRTPVKGASSSASPTATSAR